MIMWHACIRRGVIVSLLAFANLLCLAWEVGMCPCSKYTGLPSPHSTPDPGPQSLGVNKQLGLAQQAFLFACIRFLLNPVGSTNVKNVTTLGVVISPRQMSKHQSQHQQQTSNNDKCHRGFSSKNDKCHKCHKVNASSYYNASWTTDAGTCVSIPCRLVYCL